MSLRTFFIGLGICFGLAWLILFVGPYSAVADWRPEPYNPEIDEREGVFPNGIRPYLVEGSTIYLQEGCAQCHTQFIRPVSLSTDTWKPLASGAFDTDGVEVVPPRPSHPADYAGLDYAPFGVQRVGPDLSNVGAYHPIPALNRKRTLAWHYEHLYAPRSKNSKSVMPAFQHLFEVRPVVGQGSEIALKLSEEFAPKPRKDGVPLEVVPTDRARILVEYLMQLRHDEAMPQSLLSPDPES